MPRFARQLWVAAVVERHDRFRLAADALTIGRPQKQLGDTAAVVACVIMALTGL